MLHCMNHDEWKFMPINPMWAKFTKKGTYMRVFQTKSAH